MMKISCPHYGVCSGCSSDLSNPSPPLWEEMIEYCKEWAAPQLVQGPSHHWRCRAKLAVRGTMTVPQIGLFKRHSHSVIAIPDCLVHHPLINQAIEHIRKWIIKNQIVPYQEATGSGELRYLQLVVERQTKTVQVTFVINQKEPSELWQQKIMELENTTPHFWHSLWLNFNDRPTNTIFGLKWLKVWGEEWLWEKFGKTDVCYLPATFGQANLGLFDLMLERIRSWIMPNAKVTEYFAGVGAIGLSIADKCVILNCEEANPMAEICFQKAQQRLPKSAADKLSYTTLPAEKSLYLMQDVETVIVDPPRKGLSNPFKHALNKSVVKQLIYVSCGWESFKRDCHYLLNAGWTVKELEGYGFFPGSDHIELLGCFIKD